MPFKSLAHRERLRKLRDEGSFPKKDFETLEAESIGLDLPQRAANTPPTRKAVGRASTAYAKTSTKPQY